MKKIVYLIIPFLLVILTGCDAKLNVIIKDNDVVVKNSFIIDRSRVNDSIYYTIDRMAGKYFLSTDFLIGDTQENYEGNKAIYTKKEKFSLDDFNNSNLFSFCYDAHNVIIEDDSILITTSNNFKCYEIYDELERFDIVLKTNHKLIETNADEIKGYIYTWHIDKNNSSNKPIRIKLYKDKYVFNYDNEFVIMISIIGGIVLTILISVFIMLKKAKNANKI